MQEYVVNFEQEEIDTIMYCLGYASAFNEEGGIITREGGAKLK